jgi:hypothetical protein
MESERAMIDGNRRLIGRFEEKIQRKLGEVWGEDTSGGGNA